MLPQKKARLPAPEQAGLVSAFYESMKTQLEPLEPVW